MASLIEDDDSPLRRMTYGRSGGSAPPPEQKPVKKRQYQVSLLASKMNHIKKRDGEALWREDIQYDFLNYVFTDPTPAFTSPRNPEEKCTFADIYLEAMARSTKCSKILAEKLLCDRQAGIKIAMVCLLVNSGRMNTTLNFFPEMRTHLRTYHPIPSLQTHDTQDYKQLQDAPRLKSILKGACEDLDDVTTMETLRISKTRPRANPIALIFLMSAWSYDVKRDHFPDTDLSFSDLIIDTTKTSHSRARAFLWLVWAYLESERIMHNENNPFGSKFPMPEPVDSTNFRPENVDLPSERVFGNQMTLQRLAILSNYQDNDTKKEEHEIQSYVPLQVPRTRLRSAKDRRVNDELHELIQHKRMQRKRARLNRNTPLQDLNRFIKDIDPLYDSDDDVHQAGIDGRSHGVRSGVKATGLTTEYADYGETCASQADALNAIAAKLKK